MSNGGGALFCLGTGERRIERRVKMGGMLKLPLNSVKKKGGLTLSELGVAGGKRGEGQGCVWLNLGKKTI